MRQYWMDMKLNLFFVIKWVCFSLILGSLCGFIGALFHLSIDYVTSFRLENHWIIYLLPVGGLLIVFLYHCVHLDNQPGTNTIIESVRQQNHVPVLLAPAIFLATVITHLCGGSSGREGAALQIGGSLATSLGKVFHADKREMSMLIMCGMSAVFSALFGTPITATLFSMEVVSVGVFYYAALVPCLCSSLVSLQIARLFGCQSVSYALDIVLPVTAGSVVQLLILTFIIACFSIIFVLMMHYSHKWFQQFFPNPYWRVIVGSVIIILLAYLFGKQYLGAGMDIVEDAIYGSVLSYDFLLKAIFTVITIGCGFKGGEIVPTFFIGSTLGYTLGSLIGMNPHVCAALGLVAMFCCVINSPLTSLILGVELFGSYNLLPMAIVVAFGYVLSGYFSLYQAQKIVYSKTSPEFINKNAQ